MGICVSQWGRRLEEGPTVRGQRIKGLEEQRASGGMRGREGMASAKAFGETLLLTLTQTTLR